MAKAIRAVVGTVTKNIDKVYFVDRGSAKKISKVYAVVDGKARLVFPSIAENTDEPLVYDGTLVYEGTAAPLPTPVYSLMGASAEEYALFVGGQRKKTSTTTELLNSAVAYDKNLIQYCPEGLSDARRDGYGLGFKGEAVFAGGYSKASETRRILIESYDSSLTRKTLTDFSYEKEHASGYYPTATENYMVFPQYENSEAGAEVYDSSFTKLDSLVLGWSKRTKVSAASVDGYIIFGGGANSTGASLYADCKVYDKSLTLLSMGCALSIGRAPMGTASTDKHAFFAGNANTSTSEEYGKHVDVFDSSLTAKTVQPLSHKYYQKADNKIAVLNGNMIRPDAANNTIDKYDQSLTKETLGMADFPTYSACAAVGNFILIAGGGSSEQSGAVHKIHISRTKNNT